MPVDFYEDDEPPEDVLRAFAEGEKYVTQPPHHGVTVRQGQGQIRMRRAGDLIEVYDDVNPPLRFTELEVEAFIDACKNGEFDYLAKVERIGTGTTDRE